MGRAFPVFIETRTGPLTAMAASGDGNLAMPCQSDKDIGSGLNPGAEERTQVKLDQGWVLGTWAITGVDRQQTRGQLAQWPGAIMWTAGSRQVIAGFTIHQR